MLTSTITTLCCIFVVTKCNPLLQRQENDIKSDEELEDFKRSMLDDPNTSVTEQVGIINENADSNVYEGDIVVTDHDKVDTSDDGDANSLLGDNNLAFKRNAQRDHRRLWEKAEVPYEIHSSLQSGGAKSTIKAAIAEFHSDTCLRWVKHTSQKNWVLLTKKSGCYSNVGRVYYKPGYQIVSLGSGCIHKGVIMHEMLHASGFWHEQSRPDRDKFVKILWENIQKGKEHNFNKYGDDKIDTLKADYDFHSLMHYGSRLFSANGKPTIQAIKDPNQKLGQYGGFSKTDIFEVNALYECKGSSNHWGDWSPWSGCSEFCERSRQRQCKAQDITKHCPGAENNGIQREKEKCSGCKVPVDGHWGRWSAWGSCSKSCDTGTHTRTRLCDDPAPVHHGKPCPGSSKETGNCHIRSCHKGSGDCQFDDDSDKSCGWQQKDLQNKYRWYRRNRKTLSCRTGPYGDNTKGNAGQGYFVYAEASSPARPNDKAQFISIEFPATSGRCFTFDYHMYGDAMGMLKVYLNDLQTSSLIKIFEMSGNQGNQWKNGNVTIVSCNKYKVVFEAIRGPGYRSDIALDNIVFVDSKCGRDTGPAPKPPPCPKLPPPTKTPPPKPPISKVSQGDCTFDAGLCAWTQETTITNPFLWQRRKAGTRRYITFPAVQQKARLVSPEFPASTSTVCMTLEYFMYGWRLGTLNVYVKDAKTRQETKVFSKTNHQGRWWRKVKIPIKIQFNCKVIIEAIKDRNAKRDIAIDDVIFTERPCT